MRRGIAGSIAVLLAACAGPRTDAPPNTAVIAPASWSGGVGAGGEVTATWWQGFGDPVLTTLVEHALANNVDVAIAAARVEEARAQFDAARGQSLPNVELVEGARRELGVELRRRQLVSCTGPTGTIRFAGTGRNVVDEPPMPHNGRLGGALIPACGDRRDDSRRRTRFVSQAEREAFIQAFVRDCNRTRLRCPGYRAPLEILNNQRKHNATRGRPCAFGHEKEVRRARRDKLPTVTPAGAHPGGGCGPFLWIRRTDPGRATHYRPGRSSVLRASGGRAAGRLGETGQDPDARRNTARWAA